MCVSTKGQKGKSAEWRTSKYMKKCIQFEKKRENEWVNYVNFDPHKFKCK